LPVDRANCYHAPMASGRALSGTFRLERNLVAHFARCLRRGDTQWGRVRIAFEYDYVGGYTDVLALCQAGHLVAFEAKLARWRDAIHQAYRTRCFANLSYVVLPDAAARVALQHEREFNRRRVGLCSVSPERGIEVVLDAAESLPLQPWVAARAMTELGRGGTKARCRQIRSSSKLRKQSAQQGS
jgi:hypothetical protein